MTDLYYTGFDNEIYLTEQDRSILEWVERLNNSCTSIRGQLLYVYLRRGPSGFDPNVKMRLLQKLKDKTDVILCIHAGDIERKKVRADFGITYDVDALKTIDDFREWGIDVTAVVITRYTGQQPAKAFRNKLEHRGVMVLPHSPT
jgi:uncharacterized protein (UPF0371 family)